jgi:cell division cycle 2-like
MTGAKSRWADDEADAAARRREKEEKKRAKLERAQRDTEAAAAAEDEARRRADDDTAAAAAAQQRADDTDKRPVKRRRLSNPDEQEDSKIKKPAPLLRFAAPEWGPSRHVDNFERLNHIEEGSYGWVSRARETATAEIVALKKLKMDNTNDGFPVTALREIQTLKESRHRHIVHLREVVVGDGLNEYVLVYGLGERSWADFSSQYLSGYGVPRA